MSSKNKDRGKKPSAATGRLREPSEPRDYNKETPKFCLRYLRTGFDVHALDAEQQTDVAKKLQQLCSMTWAQITLADRHGLGSELIPAGSIKAAVPEKFSDAQKFTVLRYSGLLPMVGARID